MGEGGGVPGYREGAEGGPSRPLFTVAPPQALRSLSRYPLPLRSGGAAAILRHFGPGLCRRLDNRLRQHRAGGRGYGGGVKGGGGVGGRMVGAAGRGWGLGGGGALGWAWLRGSLGSGWGFGG